jgi:hypothetical protein
MARATEREEREREREFTYSDAIRTAIRWAPIVRDNMWLKLAACILVDFIGFCSYLLPGVGEAGDAIWAPAQAFFLQYMFSSVVITAIGFCEEIGPGTDIVPTASLAWGIENLPVRETWNKGRSLARLLLVLFDGGTLSSTTHPLPLRYLPISDESWACASGRGHHDFMCRRWAYSRLVTPFFCCVGGGCVCFFDQGVEARSAQGRGRNLFPSSEARISDTAKSTFFVVFRGKYVRDVPWLLQGA